MKVLILGSEGNVGKELVPYLKKYHKVFRVDIIQSFADDYMIADIKNSGELGVVFKKFRPEVVFNLAAMVSRITCEKSKCLTVETNLTGVMNVINLCKMYKSKLIYFSTSEVYGNQDGYLKEDIQCHPNNFYGLTKYLGEELVNYERTEGLNAIIVRPFMFYSELENFGVNRSAMIRFAENLYRKEKIEVHTGAMRSWLHMIDAVVILEKLMTVNEVMPINIGHPKLYGMDEMAYYMCKVLNISYKEYVVENALPEKMTLIKRPYLYLQELHTKYTPQIDLFKGIDRVLEETKKRLS
jgi:nucleoside-diphosphate-sugar epimerase